MYLTQCPSPTRSTNHALSCTPTISEELHGYTRKIGAYKTPYATARKVAIALSLDLTGEEQRVVARALQKYLVTQKIPIHHHILHWPPGSTDGPDTSVFVSQVVSLKDDPDLGKRELEEREEDKAAKTWLIEHDVEEDELEWVSLWHRFDFMPYGIEEHGPLVEYTYSEPKEPREKEEREKEKGPTRQELIAKMANNGDLERIANWR
ncbi:hypothetical protein EWM64_g7945 [Hericium alpestre]|uniref:Uncharacterized protein n=1 Tax=Hericium alpestre TaxID=135208 RepID=A0A4Y9ZPT2_9AGAM|nr:hypothetical protein EWM64_g7945 [Hericium alpestre]